MVDKTIWTIGHYNYPIEDFISYLTENGIEALVDIRSIPGSNRSPQYNQTPLSDSLYAAGIGYVYLAKLGGRRRAQHVDPTINAGWQNKSFKNYADYTTTQDFSYGLKSLEKLAGAQPVAYMCGEPMPWRCHRSIVSTNLVARSWTVNHIMQHKVCQHQLGQWGAKPRVQGVTVTFPDTTLPEPLFSLT